ncbi:hypothetical protein D3C86_1976340 [compost metagenome]
MAVHLLHRQRLPDRLIGVFGQGVYRLRCFNPAANALERISRQTCQYRPSPLLDRDVNIGTRLEQLTQHRQILSMIPLLAPRHGQYAQTVSGLAERQT